tara:strand:+ start:37 stop:867 length:831 start_codon:yes stop_codon:yes gene_type:complete
LNTFIKIETLILTKNIKITILISTYNKSGFIKNTIKSCLNQNYKNYEIVVVDTGSNDGTVEKLKSYFKFRKIKIIYIKRKYESSALNQINAIETGLSISKGKIICLLDGDDKFRENKLKEINNFFLKNQNASLVQDTLKSFKNLNYYKELNRYFLFFKILPRFFPTSTFSIRKDSLKKFLKNHSFKNLSLLEIDARLYFFSKIFKKNHLFVDKRLTIYTHDPNGISSKYKKFSSQWLKKRKQAHIFLKSFYKNNKYPYKTDFILTRLLHFIIKTIN